MRVRTLFAHTLFFAGSVLHWTGEGFWWVYDKLSDASQYLTDKAVEIV